jgi:hypothetical protein
MLITPSRWFAGARKTVDKFTETIMNEKGNVPFIKHFPDSTLLFDEKTDIMGGANYFCFD